MEDAVSYPLGEITEQIIGCAIRVHRDLGPGLLESAYQACLAHELSEVGLTAQREVPFRLLYRDVDMGIALRADLVVEDSVVVEVKAIRQLEGVHRCQILTYLRASGLPVGLILNFGQQTLRDGVMRVINSDPDPR